MAKSARQLGLDLDNVGKAKPGKPPTVASWKKVIAEIQRRARTTTEPHARFLLLQELNAATDGLKAAQKVAAVSPTFVTGTNLFALTQKVIENGPSFSNRIEAVHRDHIKRCLDAGLVEPAGNQLRLTPAGKTAVGDALIAEINRKVEYRPIENAFVPPEKRAEVLAKDRAKHAAEIDKLEVALASVTK